MMKMSWRFLLALSWIAYGLSIYFYYSDGEKIWTLSIWCTIFLSLLTFGGFFVMRNKFAEASTRARILYLLLAVTPALLAIPTAYFISL